MDNILLVGNWPSDTGYAWWLMERFWIAIAERYQIAGRKVYVCFPEVRGVSKELTAAGIEVIEFPFDLSRPSLLQTFVKKHHIRHIYLTDRKYVSATYISLRLAGVRTIIIHDHTPGDRTAPRGLRRIAKMVMARFPGITADAYIAVSQPVMDRLRKVVFLPQRKCHLATNGIDVERFEIIPKTNIRTELGLPQDAIIVVSVGRATRYKGIHTIIEAASSLKRTITAPLYFVHCGDGPDMKLFQELIDGLDMQDQFLLLGKRSDIAAILKSADIAVHASEGEGLSLAILEFMAAGLAIALPDSPTVSQSIIDGHSGLTYRTGDAADLAQKLNKLVNSTQLRAELGSAAAITAREKYNLGSTIDRVLSVFSTLKI